MSNSESSAESAAPPPPANDEPSLALSALKEIQADAAKRKGELDRQIAAAVSSIEGTLANVTARATEIGTLKDDLTALKAAGEADASKARASVAEIETFKTAIATSKGGIEEMQRSAAADIGVITQLKLDIEKLNSEAAALSKKATTEYEEVAKTVAALQERRTALKAALDELDALNADTRQKSESVANDVNAIATAKATFDALIPQAQAAFEDLSAKQTAAAERATEIIRLNQEVTLLHTALFADTAEKKSTKTDVEELHAKINSVLQATELQQAEGAATLGKFRLDTEKELKTWLSDQDIKFSTTYSNLRNQILSLLPSAGSAGLASTYYDAKSRYAVTAYHAPLEEGGSAKKVSQFREWLGHNPTSLIATVFFYALFLGPMAVIIWLFFDVLSKISASSGTPFSTQYLVFRALIALPLGTVSLFGYSSLRLYRRLYEEYNYKQRVMELYLSFAKEIETKGTEDQKEALLAIMLKAVSDKPSVSMHRYDGIVSDSAFKIDLSGIFAKLFGGHKP